MKKILIVDIETTGFVPAKNFIVEIGIVSLDLENGKREILFDKVVHEKGITKDEVLNSWIVKNKYMNVEEIRQSKVLDFYKEEIQGIFNAHPLGVTAYNKQFDFGFLGNRGFKYKELPCPMLICTDVCKIPSNRGRGYKWPNVEEAYNFLLPAASYAEIHRGADDAFHEAQIVLELYKRGLFRAN